MYVLDRPYDLMNFPTKVTAEMDFRVKTPTNVWPIMEVAPSPLTFGVSTQGAQTPAETVHQVQTWQKSKGFELCKACSSLQSLFLFNFGVNESTQFLSGYTSSDGGMSCTFQGPCHISNGGCSPMAVCFATSGQVQCYCQTGYAGTGVGPFGCAPGLFTDAILYCQLFLQSRIL